MKPKIITFQMTDKQVDTLDEAWKATPKCLNRTQYIKQALNAYSGKTIFEEAKQ